MQSPTQQMQMMKMMQMHRTMYRFHCSRQRSGCSSCTFSNGRGGVLLLKATYTFFYLKNMIKAFPGYPGHAKYVVLSVLGNLEQFIINKCYRCFGI